jgi:hypothetical protein
MEIIGKRDHDIAATRGRDNYLAYARSKLLSPRINPAARLTRSAWLRRFQKNLNPLWNRPDASGTSPAFSRAIAALLRMEARVPRAFRTNKSQMRIAIALAACLFAVQVQVLAASTNTLSNDVAQFVVMVEQNAPYPRLLQSARRSERAFAGGKLRAGIAHLRTFQHRVSAVFRGDSTADFLVPALIGSAQRIIDCAQELRNGGPIISGNVMNAEAAAVDRPIGDLLIDMWNWLDSIPVGQNPQIDETGQWATNRQPNPVVFYIPSANGNMEQRVRMFSVPEHKHILMPVMGVTIDNIDVVPPLTIPQLRDVLDSALGNPVALSATIDGVDVANLIAHRAPSPPFSVYFHSNDNVQTFFYGHPIVDWVDPIIADGYWLLLEPFSTGSHVLHGRGENTFQLPHDITSHITVEPVPLEQWMQALKYWVQGGPAGNALIPDLNQAEALFRRHRIQAGISKLRSFQNKVEIYLLPANATQARNLMRYAERIIERAGKEH